MSMESNRNNTRVVGLNLVAAGLFAFAGYAEHVSSDDFAASATTYEQQSDVRAKAMSERADRAQLVSLGFFAASGLLTTAAGLGVARARMSRIHELPQATVSGSGPDPAEIPPTPVPPQDEY